MDQSISAILFISAILVFGGILFAIITLTRKGPSRLDIEKYRSRWITIEQQLKRNESQSYHMAVVNADKLLDQALKEKGINGETMAMRMKVMQRMWSHANAVWAAHKLRNRIAHEPDVNASYDDARRALAAYKEALKDMGAL